MRRGAGSICHWLFREGAHRKGLIGKSILLAIVLLPGLMGRALGQGGYNDNRVMMQGFMWESHQSGRQRAAGGAEYDVDWRGKWYDEVRSNAQELADAEIDLIW